MKTIKAKVHMLPTEEGLIYRYKPDGKLYYNTFFPDREVPQGQNTEPQHLYITADEVAKKGDYYIHQDLGKKPIVKRLEIEGDFLAKKIIATTDPKLTQCPSIKREGESCPKNNNCKYPNCVAPQIPQSFIEEYCKAGGIDKVLVEVECLTSSHASIVDWSKEPIETEALSEPKCIEHRIKLNPDNTIIIKKKKDTWNKEEVAQIIENFSWECTQGVTQAQVKKWIEENL